MPMPTDELAAAIGHALHLPPAAAVAYLRQKGYAVSWRWWDVWQDAHHRAFTVAKMARFDLLQQTRAIVDRALATGMSEAQAAAALEERLRAAGWWGKQIIVDERGDAERVQLGSPRRLKTILRTNFASAYAAGREARQRETHRARPYWMYVAVLDPSTRDRHRELHGTIWPADSPAWDSIYPPNGFNCRCRVRALTEAQVRALGRRVIDDAELDDVEQEVGVNRQTGEVVTRAGRRVSWRGPGDERRTFTPDPGWSHRPGRVPPRPGPGGAPDPDDPDWRTWARPAAADLEVTPPLDDPAGRLVDPPRVAHRSRVRTITGDAAAGTPFVRTPVERVSVARRHADEDGRLVPALADPDEVWLTHYPATSKRRAEYRVRYLRATADGGDLVTVRPDGSLRVANVSRERLDRQRRGALLHARGRPVAGIPEVPTRAAERELAQAARRVEDASAAVGAAVPGSPAHQAAQQASAAAYANYNAVRARYRAAWNDLRAAAPDIDAASPQAAAVLREARAVVDDPGLTHRERTIRLRAVVERPLDPELARRVDLPPEHHLAVEQWTQYVSPSLARRQARVGLTQEPDPGNREWARRVDLDRAELNVHPHTERHTTVHELGHTVEYSNDALAAEAAAYLRRRSKGVGDLGDDGDYVKGIGHWDGVGEQAYFDRYTGRLYPQATYNLSHADEPRFFEIEGRRAAARTEVISMGLDRLAEDPVLFARRDWDFFSFIVRRVLWRD